MDLTSVIVWAILIVVVAALVFAGSWFSLRTLRTSTIVTAIVLTIAVTRFGLTHPEYKPTNLVDSFLSGADQVAIALLHPFWRGAVPAPGVIGRWIIAVALLLGYRQLEGLAIRRQAPELDLSAIGGRQLAGHSPRRPAGWLSHWHDEGRAARERRNAELAAELRFRLPTMEVRSPSILPGGARTNALASIAETSGVSGAGMVGAIFRFAGVFWPRPSEFRVRSWVESAEGTRITVLLEDVKTGLPMATKTVAGSNFNEAASMVTGYIARQVFAMDRTVPEWCYGMADGRDLGAMQLVRLERFYAACDGEVRESRKLQIRILRGETGTDRTAGIVRYELAQLLALDDQHLESLRLHALNRELHPRFYRGRYRLAMSLEMIASREHYLRYDEAMLRKLAETLEIISRHGHKDGQLQEDAKTLRDTADRLVAPPSAGPEAPCMRVERKLAVKLLEIAARDLREVRTQLSLGHVLWDAFSRRDERAVWLPHRNRRYRRSFQDGVCAAELLVAVKCRLREAQGRNPGWLKQARARWHLRPAVMIARCIAGDPSFIRSALADPCGNWWEPKASKSALDRLSRAWERWLPWRRSSMSWQAAYNTACLYAALADAGRDCAPEDTLRALENRVIVSLRRVVDNPRSELERAWDWISGDPDFRVMRDDPKKFKAFGEFLSELKQQEYPASTVGKCHHSHRSNARNLAVTERRSASEEPPIFSPVPNAIPVGDGERAYVLSQIPRQLLDAVPRRAATARSQE